MKQNKLLFGLVFMFLLVLSSVMCVTSVNYFDTDRINQTDGDDYYGDLQQFDISEVEYINITFSIDSATTGASSGSSSWFAFNDDPTNLNPSFYFFMLNDADTFGCNSGSANEWTYAPAIRNNSGNPGTGSCGVYGLDTFNLVISNLDTGVNFSLYDSSNSLLQEDIFEKYFFNFSKFGYHVTYDNDASTWVWDSVNKEYDFISDRSGSSRITGSLESIVIYLSSVVETNFTITAYDNYTNNTLTDFTAYVGNYTFNDSGTGTITTNITNNNGSLFNITITKDNWFNSTYLNYNVSSNLDASMIGTNVTLRIVYNNTNITAVVSNATLLDITNNRTFIDDTGYFNINPAPLINTSFNISCNRQVFEVRNFELNFNARDQAEYIIYVEPTLNYFYFYDEDTNLSIANATIDITYPSGYTTTKTTNTNGEISFSWVNSSQELDFGNYTFEFDKVGYNLITFTEEILSTDVPVNNSYNISTALLNISIYDLETYILLSANVSLELLGVFNNNTLNGSFIYKDLSLIPGEYTIQATADGYGTTEKTFTFTNQEELNINLYMLNSSSVNAGTHFVEIVNQNYQKKKGVTVSLYEYNPSLLDYIKIDGKLSNNNGEVAFLIELNVKRYIITAEYTEDGTTYTDSTIPEGTIFSVDNDVTYLQLKAAEDNYFSISDHLRYTISETFVNNQSSINIYFKRTDGLTTTVCIDYYLIDGTSETRLTNDLTACTTSTSAFQNFPVTYLLNRSNNYEARVTETYAGKTTLLKSFYYPSEQSIQEILEEYNYTGIVLFFLTIGLIAGGLALNKVGVICVLMPILHWSFALKLFPQKTFLSVAVLVTFICIFMFKDIRVKQEVQ